MKKRIDIDIKQIKTEDDYLDYSNPKMFMISGHDSTIACHEMFIINCLDLDIEKNFKLPKYGGQFALEITRREATVEEIKKMTYKDYTVNYYFNDELLYTISVDLFLKKIEPKLWTDEQIDEFCGFNKHNKENNIIILMSGTILFSLFLIFLTTTIILSVKLVKIKSRNNTERQISLIGRGSLNDV